MRCRRLCERKPSGRFNIDETVADEHRKGGASREALEMALLESLAKHGTERRQYSRVKAGKPCKPCTCACMHAGMFIYILFGSKHNIELTTFRVWGIHSILSTPSSLLCSVGVQDQMQNHQRATREQGV